MKDRETQLIEAVSTLATIVNKLMDDVLKMAVEIKEIRKELNDRNTA
jgi:hypothetical protein